MHYTSLHCSDLSKNLINAAHLNSDTLVGKYAPNLVKKPFEVSKEYAQLIDTQTLPAPPSRLEKMRKSSPEHHHRQKLAYIIIVELLAYQFASPVCWIEA